MAFRLDKDQRRRLSAYLRKSKPQAWRNLLEVLNQGPAWKAYGLYYETVRVGGVSDSIFRERWSVDGHMPSMPSVATQTEKGLIQFLSGIRQNQLQTPPQSSAGPFPAPDPISTPAAPPEPFKGYISPLRPEAEAPKPAKERKRTVSLMIEPSLYDRVKRLADLQERSVGAQIRHAIRQDLDRHADLLGDAASD